ncbi:MAG: twin-arginine translocation signal domain-containing protein, partial [Bacteroidota bacterium]
MSTNNTKQINRRAFLRNTTLAGGGLVIGFNLL